MKQIEKALKVRPSGPRGAQISVDHIALQFVGIGGTADAYKDGDDLVLVKPGIETAGILVGKDLSLRSGVIYLPTAYVEGVGIVPGESKMAKFVDETGTKLILRVVQ